MYSSFYSIYSITANTIMYMNNATLITSHYYIVYLILLNAVKVYTHARSNEKVMIFIMYVACRTHNPRSVNND
jgi:hypothetical protein